MKLRELIQEIRDYGIDLDDEDQLDDVEVYIADISYRSNKEVSVDGVIVQDDDEGPTSMSVYLQLGYETKRRYLQGEVREEWGQ